MPSPETDEAALLWFALVLKRKTFNGHCMWAYHRHKGCRSQISLDLQKDAKETHAETPSEINWMCVLPIWFEARATGLQAALRSLFFCWNLST